MPRMSQAEFNAYQARQNVKALPHIEGACEHEVDLHEQIFAECRRRGWIPLHGAMSERTHRTLGEEDFIIRADGGRVFWIECKSRTGKLSPAQQAIHVHAARLGHVSNVVRSFEEFLKLL